MFCESEIKMTQADLEDAVLQWMLNQYPNGFRPKVAVRDVKVTRSERYRVIFVARTENR